MAVLDPDAVATALTSLPGWESDGTSIVRTASLPSFPDAITLVTRVAADAEEADHHPDIDIRWRSVTFRLSTHSEGGITEKDLAMAGKISERIAAFG